MGHSKFHNTSNHPPPATDSSRTARTSLYPSVQEVPPLLNIFVKMYIIHKIVCLVYLLVCLFVNLSFSVHPFIDPCIHQWNLQTYWICCIKYYTFFYLFYTLGTSLGIFDRRALMLIASSESYNLQPFLTQKCRAVADPQNLLGGRYNDMWPKAINVL